MVILVKNKSEITVRDIPRLIEKWKEQWKTWVVINDFIVYGSYESREEAEKVAKLISKADEVTKEIKSYADKLLDELTEEEKDFIRKYAGNIEIEI